MKRLVSVTMFTACLPAVAQGVSAEDCSGWNNSHLRGTYTMTGSGYKDLAKLIAGNPANLPSGMTPMSWVGAYSIDGAGGVSGWVTVNAGGLQLTAQFSGSYAVKADCSVTINYTMKAKEIPRITLGPYTRLAVIGGKMDALELNGILLGEGPATELDTFNSRRISME